MERNHGIREANALQVLLPLGVDVESLDAAWLATVDSFGERRGEAAHSSGSSALKHPPDPKSEFDTVRQIVEGLKQLDSLLSWSAGLSEMSVEGLEKSLYAYLVEHLPGNLELLSAATMVDGVADVEIERLAVACDGIEVRGSAIADVTLQFGGVRDGSTTSDSYPFRFKAHLDSDLRVQAAEVEVDTSSFYE